MEAAEWSMCWSLRTKRTSETCWWNNLRSEVKVRKADNGATGLQRVSELVPDVIFVDVNMPVMDGFLFVSELRQNPETAKVQVVLVTAINIPDVESRALALGVKHHLAKPWDPESLEQVLPSNGSGSKQVADQQAWQR